jgi:hypothetical protein
LTDKKDDWRWVFLGVLAQTCCVSKACVASRVSRQTAYNHRKRFPKFRKKWDEAIEVGIEVLEAEVRYRALDRNDPASHILLMFLLKAHKPRVYRDNGHLIPEDDAEVIPSTLTSADLAKLAPHELDALESIAGKIIGGAGENLTDI